MTRFARRRLTICLTLIASLLFQQVAVAAFACAKEVGTPPPVPAMAHCAEMAMASAQAQAQSPALCEKHCSPDQSVQADPGVAGVPSLALPPLSFALVLDTSVSQSIAATQVPISRSDPPPRLRFCSLLI